MIDREEVLRLLNEYAAGRLSWYDMREAVKALQVIQKATAKGLGCSGN